MIGLLLLAVSVRADPGEHIPIGNATLAPRVSLGVEYSTNAYKSQSDPVGATNLKLAPGFDLELNRDDLRVAGRGTYELRKYFAPSQVPLDRYDDFLLEAGLDAFRQSILGIRFQEVLEQRNNTIDASWQRQPFLTQLRNQTTGALAVRPWSALEVTVGGRYVLDDYTAADASAADGTAHYNTRHTYGPTGGMVLNFLPRTALVLDFSYEHSLYQSPIVRVQDSADLYLPDHDTVRIMGGLRGLITERMEVTLLGGYGSGEYDEGSVGGLPAAAADVTGLEHLLVDVAVRYALGPEDTLVVGVQKNFSDSYFTNYTAFSKGYVWAEGRLAERLGTSAEVSLMQQAFRGVESRDDLVLSAKGEVSYYVQEWASISGGPTWQQRWSDEPTVEYGELVGHLLLNMTY